jgi:very-short-patch-repair endonuclease
VAGRGPGHGTRRDAEPRERGGALGIGRGPPQGARHGAPRAADQARPDRDPAPPLQIPRRRTGHPRRHPGDDRLLRLREVAVVYDNGYGRRRARKRTKPFLDAERRYVEDTASPLEERFADFCTTRRLPPPQTNVLIDGDEVHALWPAARLIVELDSWEFHAHRKAFETDRSRDTDHLLAGYRTMRVTHRRLSVEPDRLAAQIRALLDAAPLR